MPTRKNRRARARLLCLLTVEYRAAAGWRSAAVLDVSKAGCRLRVGEDLPRGTGVGLRFAAPLADGSTSATLEADAVVKWCRREGLGHRAGLSFRTPATGLEPLLRVLERR